MAARITGPLFTNWRVVNGSYIEGYYDLFRLPDLESQPYLVIQVTKAGAGHFPYGYAVEPDGPA